MKRRVILGAVLAVLICCCAALNAKAFEPDRFTGAWYRAGDGALYIFEDGLIQCAEHETLAPDDEAFSGAYCFAKEKTAMFLVDSNGVSEVVELYLVHRPDGDILCETMDGTGKIWFCRNQGPG